MKPEEIAAYIGAAAWAPQIAVWLYKAYVKPEVHVVPDHVSEVGFTSFGPVFNVKLAFFAKEKDVIVDSMELLIKHEDGDVRTLRWAGLGEQLSEITDGEGRKQIISRDQSPIALKIATDSNLVEKFVRFQEPRFHAADRPLVSALVSHQNFLKARNPEGYVDEVLASRELRSAIDGRKNAFWWKAGRYDATLRLGSPQRFAVKGASFGFNISALDHELLKQNLALHETELPNVVRTNIPGFEIPKFAWVWANVELNRVART